MKHANNQDGVMLWVKRDDEGNITDWEMTIKRDDLIKILSEVIDELKESGKQIPAEDIGNIWIKFYKVDKARTREYGGNGIGLSIVKAIMDSFHRDCGVINHADGVEFWFELDTKNN